MTAAGRAVLIAAICCASGVRAAEWSDELSVPPFVFRAEFPLRDVAALVDELGELQKDIESTLDLRCSDREIQIYLFRTRFSYQSYLKRNVPEGIGRQALFVAGNDVGRVYAYRHQGIETDLRHEVTHALLHNALPYVPLWLDEGIAEYFEAPRSKRVDGNSHQVSLKWSVRFGNVPNLADLEAKRKLADFTGSDYRDAWGWIHFLLHGPNSGREALDEFLRTIPTGREPTPLSLSLPRRMPDFRQQFIDHVRR